MINASRRVVIFNKKHLCLLSGKKIVSVVKPLKADSEHRSTDLHTRLNAVLAVLSSASLTSLSVVFFSHAGRSGFLSVILFVTLFYLKIANPRSKKEKRPLLLQFHSVADTLSLIRKSSLHVSVKRRGGGI